jgi:hypothetical protein
MNGIDQNQMWSIVPGKPQYPKIFRMITNGTNEHDVFHSMISHFDLVEI